MTRSQIVAGIYVFLVALIAVFIWAFAGVMRMLGGF